MFCWMKYPGGVRQFENDPWGHRSHWGTFVRGISLWDRLQILESESSGRSNRTCSLGEWSIGREGT